PRLDVDDAGGSDLDPEPALAGGDGDAGVDDTQRRRPPGMRGDPADAPMRPVLVVVVAEHVQQRLQLGQRTWAAPALAQPLLERLLEALDLAAGLGVVG